MSEWHRQVQLMVETIDACIRTQQDEALTLETLAKAMGYSPAQMQMMDVEEGEYIVFEHGPFDFKSENQSVEAKIEQAMKL